MEAKLPIYDEELADLMPRLRDRLERVFENRLFVLYRIQENGRGQGGMISH